MKNDETNFGSVLREWRVTSTLPPRFREQVWKRIERVDAPGTSLLDAFRAWLEMAFARPAFAVAYVSLLLFAGLAFGSAQAGQKTTDWDRQLQARYMQSVDPYQNGER